jgi:fucose permease
MQLSQSGVHISRTLPSFFAEIASYRLELIIWLVPSLIGDGVAIAIVGVFLGPMFPIAMNHAGRVLPRWLLTGSIGWIAGFGQAGSAVLPFITGALASNFGIKTLQPV